jgi:two-component system, NarL family, nitrate/nitrite sensor histidine kinase NarX
MRMLVRAFRSGSWPADEATMREGLDSFVDQVDSALQSLDRGLRELVETFETPRLADRSLEDSVRDSVLALESDTSLTASLELRGDFAVLSRSQHIALLRILSEALTNVRKHADASRVWVTMSVSGGRARLRVRDDGRGFDLGRTPRVAAGGGRWGLIGMAERARLLGGRCEVSTQPGGPTSVTVVIPAGQVEELPEVLERPTEELSSG